jgi:hypothetical protein
VTNVLALGHLSSSGSIAFGVVSAAVAAGATAGPLISQRAEKHSSAAVVGAAVVFGILEIAMGFYGPIAVYCLAGFGAGLAFSSFMLLSVTSIKQQAEPGDRPAILGWFSMVTIGLVPAGTLLAGWLARFGDATTLTVPGVLCILAGSVYFLHVRRRKGVPL